LNATHFSLRARERVGVEDTSALFQDLRIALSDPERWSDYIEHVRPTDEGKDIWRFRTADGVFYVIAAGAYPVTLMTQKQIRAKKFGLKMQRKGAKRGVRMP
jgi:hypothetical protein